MDASCNFEDKVAHEQAIHLIALLYLTQAVKTYTHCLKEIDEGKLPTWAKKSPPEFAKHYWGLGVDSTMRDLVLAVRTPPSRHPSHSTHAIYTLIMLHHVSGLTILSAQLTVLSVR